MNKLLKGAVAGAAGVALLLGGAGTFALWNGTAATPAGSITAGTLTIAPATAAGVWKDASTTTPATIDISTFKTVPGDKLTYTKDVVIAATGNNLSATLKLDPATIVSSTTNAAASSALKTTLLAGMTVSATGTGVAPAAAANEYTVTPNATGTSTVTVTVTLPFPKGDLSAGNNAAQAGAVDLTGLAFTLTQVRV